MCQNDFFQDHHRVLPSSIAAPSNEKQPTEDPNIVEFINLPVLHGVSKTKPELVAVNSSNLNRFSKFFYKSFNLSSSEEF